jgi:hypothetical protein
VARVRDAAPAPTRRRLRRARGPLEIRDEWMLAQPRLTLPGISPDPLLPGQWRVRTYFNMGNDFGWMQTGPAEMPFDREFLIDGEHRTFSVSVRKGVRPDLDVGIRVPVHWRGNGFMDAIIDWFHDLTEGIGFLDNGRPAFHTDRWRVEGRDPAFNPIAWTEHETGLGNIEMNAQWAFLRSPQGRGWRAALAGRVTLPTGGGPYDTDSVDAGVQVAVARCIGQDVDVYGGIGATWFSEEFIDGLQYEPWRVAGFVAVEWRPASTWSLIAQFDASSRLVTNLSNYPGFQSYIHVAAKIDLSACWVLELGFTENLEDQQATIDFGVFAALEVRF